jgi:hypothetical protein
MFLSIDGGRSQTPTASTPPGGPPSTYSASVVAAAGPATSTPRGPSIDVFSFGDARCRHYRQHPPWGPPSTSSSSVVAAGGPLEGLPLIS